MEPGRLPHWLRVVSAGPSEHHSRMILSEVEMRRKTRNFVFTPSPQKWNAKTRDLQESTRLDGIQVQTFNLEAAVDY